MRIRNESDLQRFGIGTRHHQQIQSELKQEKHGSTNAAPCSSTKARATTIRVSRGSGSGKCAPQEMLERLVLNDQVLSGYSWASDFKEAVPDRKFELDLCIPTLKCGIETDGWAFHGKRKASFLRDREKDYLLTMAGWQVLRIQAGLIDKQPGEALERVRRFIAYWEPRQRMILSSAL